MHHLKSFTFGTKMPSHSTNLISQRQYKLQKWPCSTAPQSQWKQLQTIRNLMFGKILGAGLLVSLYNHGAPWTHWTRIGTPDAIHHFSNMRKMYSTTHRSLTKLIFIWKELSTGNIFDSGLWSSHISPHYTNPCDFILQGYLQDKLFIRKPNTLINITALNQLCREISGNVCARLQMQTFILKRSQGSTVVTLNTLCTKTIILLRYSGCVIYNILLQNTEAKQNLNGSTFCAPPCSIVYISKGSDLCCQPISVCNCFLLQHYHMTHVIWLFIPEWKTE